MANLIDFFAGRLGWAIPFLERGWRVFAVDLTEPPNLAELLVKYPKLTFIKADVLYVVERQGLIGIPSEDGDIEGLIWVKPDFICASSPCEQFSVFGLTCFHPNPPHPELGIRLFNHARDLCEASGVPYILENVRSAERFVGKAVMRCGPFALWGTGVPPILPQGIRKGISIGSGKAVQGMTPAEKKTYRKQFAALQMGSKSAERKKETAAWATIPSELSNTVASYAERLLEKKAELNG